MLVIHDDNGDDDDDELVKGSQMHVEVKVVEAYDLPPALCNYVFCQYKFWNDDNTIVVPPINASISQPGPKTNTMIFEHKQVCSFAQGLLFICCTEYGVFRRRTYVIQLTLRGNKGTERKNEI